MATAAPDLQGITQSLRAMGMPEDSVGEVLDLIARRLAAPAPVPPRTASLSDVARQFHKYSLKRTAQLGQRLVADAAWNMLLDLFAATEEGEAVCVSSLCYASGSPPSTALRYLNAMEQLGLVRRAGDAVDGRRVLMQTTPKASDTMRELVFGFCVSPPVVAPSINLLPTS